MITFIVIAAVAGLLIGAVGGFLYSRSTASGQARQIETDARKQAEEILRQAKADGENLVKDKKVEAKEHFLQKKSEFEAEMNSRRDKQKNRDNQLKDRQNNLNKQADELKQSRKEIDRLKDDLEAQLSMVSAKKEALDKEHDEMVRRLEQQSGLSKDEAMQQMMETVRKEAQTRSMAHIKEVMDEAKARANKEAKKIVIQTIQRTAAENTIENSVSVFNLDSDDQKGQIIGREGRNIRALESATGCEIVVDDTPEAIIISGFDPVRREIARLSLQRLTADGRIHPGRIEQIVAKTKKQLEEHIMEIGERAVIDLGISGLHQQLVRYVGRMRFRSSYGQNLLQHSREVANLCATMAAELGLNAKLAKRAGLLHDIGKVPEEETELSHALLGAKICEKYGEKDAVCNAVGAHHDEMEMKFAISPLVQACDAISGARPGARREIMESYIQRLKDLENLALGFEGVHKAYAIQAGRELRVIVESGTVDDARSETLSFEISDKIQREMTYPGQVKVTVIREKRAVSIAR